jgi:hypothetical protein
MQTAKPETRLIPSPETVRAELARSVRETRRLRSLLKLSLQTEDDRRFVAGLPGANRQLAAQGQAVTS